jgi:hypothetical protein
MKFTEKEKEYLISATEKRIRILVTEIGNEKEKQPDKIYQSTTSIIDKVYCDPFPVQLFEKLKIVFFKF